MFNKRKYKYRVLLRGGGSFRIDADDLDLSWDDDTGIINRFDFRNPKGEVPTHLRPEDIATIVEIK